MTSKDPSSPIIQPAFVADTTRGPHPCESCQQYVALDLAPGCAIGAHWFMMKRPNWQCRGFDREPGDQ